MTAGIVRLIFDHPLIEIPGAEHSVLTSFTLRTEFTARITTHLCFSIRNYRVYKNLDYFLKMNVTSPSAGISP